MIPMIDHLSINQLVKVKNGAMLRHVRESQRRVKDTVMHIEMSDYVIFREK